MYIIPLVGKSNSGKTSSIKHLIIKMLGIEGIEIIYTSKFSKSKANKNELIDLIKDPWDGKNAGLDITVLLKYEGKRIYITTNGDCIKDILNNLKNVIEKYGTVDICVCGRHKYNQIKREFSAYSCIVGNVIKKERAINGDFDKENRKTGKELFSEIENVLQTR